MDTEDPLFSVAEDCSPDEEKDLSTPYEIGERGEPVSLNFFESRSTYDSACWVRQALALIIK